MINVRVNNSTATLSHIPNVPTSNADEGEIVLFLKQSCLKVCKVSRLVKASTHTPFKLVPDVLNGRKIWRHRRLFHNINVFAVKNCAVARAVWDRTLSCCSIVTPLPL